MILMAFSVLTEKFIARVELIFRLEYSLRSFWISREYEIDIFYFLNNLLHMT